jgi:hypothetical protein
MSYDLQIWSTNRPDLAELLAKYDFKPSDKDYYYEAKDWQIVINAQSEVLDEDIPDQIMNILPGIKYLLQINLEPIGAPKKAVALTNKAAQEIAKLSTGVIVNPQEDTITTPKGVKRLVETERLQKIDIVELSWWMNHDQFTATDNLQKLVEAIEIYLPEALPKRYGSHEPPQLKYASKNDLVTFITKNEGTIVWYPNYPVMNVHLAIPPKVGPITWGGKPRYRASYITLQLDAVVLNQSGWPLALKRFFREMSVLLNPFYGDIRVLRNYLRGRGTVWSNSDTEDHPIKSWWWRGIPKKAGLAIVLGDPLLEIWPEFAAKSKKVADLYIADDYQDGSLLQLNQNLFVAPKGLTQPENDEFPELWPFELPK